MGCWGGPASEGVASVVDRTSFASKLGSRHTLAPSSARHTACVILHAVTPLCSLELVKVSAGAC